MKGSYTSFSCSITFCSIRDFIIFHQVHCLFVNNKWEFSFCHWLSFFSNESIPFKTIQSVMIKKFPGEHLSLAKLGEQNFWIEMISTRLLIIDKLRSIKMSLYTHHHVGDKMWTFILCTDWQAIDDGCCSHSWNKLFVFDMQTEL